MGNTAESFLLNSTSPVFWSITSATLELSSSGSFTERKPRRSPLDRLGRLATRTMLERLARGYAASCMLPLLLRARRLALRASRRRAVAVIGVLASLRASRRWIWRASSRLSRFPLVATTCLRGALATEIFRMVDFLRSATLVATGFLLFPDCFRSEAA
ncbi:hypothetical protein D9M68_837350 [compost metagenome]